MKDGYGSPGGQGWAEVKTQSRVDKVNGGWIPIPTHTHTKP